MRGDCLAHLRICQRSILLVDFCTQCQAPSGNSEHRYSWVESHVLQWLTDDDVTSGHRCRSNIRSSGGGGGGVVADLLSFSCHRWWIGFIGDVPCPYWLLTHRAALCRICTLIPSSLVPSVLWHCGRSGIRCKKIFYHAAISKVSSLQDLQWGTKPDSEYSVHKMGRVNTRWK